jgi:hypothetical protein
MLASLGLKVLTALPKSFGWAVREEEKALGTGIFLQAHYIDEYWPFLHLSLRVRPKAQARWRRKLPGLLEQLDDTGHRYFTIGAGPVDGRLVPDLNRPNDVARPKVYVERLRLGAARSEDEQIQRLLGWHRRFSGRLCFTPIPWPWAGGKANNCNAYAASLLALLKVPRPKRLPHRFYVPSFKTPLALSEFI